VSLVAPSEPFSLGWGSHDGVRVTRRRDHRVERSRITGSQSHTFEVELRVGHSGDQSCRVELLERVPVSELPQVTVGTLVTEPKPDAAMDGDGFLRWSLELGPGDHRVIELSYVVDAPSRVTLPF
jgi:hypothetical protein